MASGTRGGCTLQHLSGISFVAVDRASRRFDEIDATSTAIRVSVNLDRPEPRGSAAIRRTPCRLKKGVAPNGIHIDEKFN